MIKFITYRDCSVDEVKIVVKNCNNCGRPIHHLNYNGLCWVCYNEDLK